MIKLKLCAYRLVEEPLEISKELNDKVYELTHSTIDDFEPDDEDLIDVLEQLKKDGNVEAEVLLNRLNWRSKDSDKVAFEWL